MNAITEPERRVPVAHTADVCVVGGSCTGVFAAVRAARLGASVAIVEANGFFGGTATASLVAVWHRLHDTGRTCEIIGGLTRETLDRLARRGAVMTHNPSTTWEAWALNTEELKIELDQFVAEHRIRPFLHARFAAPAIENGALRAVVIEDKSGRRAIAARYFVDATGDGDLVARMGLETEKRSDLQPPTGVAILDNYSDVVRRNPRFDLGATVCDARYPEALPRGFLWGTNLPGRPAAFMVAGTRASDADCSDADQLTQAEMECRRQIRRMLDILRRHVAGGETVALANAGSSIGVRETRHAVCLHTLGEQELLTGVRFADAIANGTYCVDVHHSRKPGLTMRFLDGRELYKEPTQPGVWGRWRPESEGITPFYQIPYRCLVPKRACNVLVAGRLIGADRGAYGAVRVMVNCNQTGEAAGVACALALDGNLGVGEVEARRLRAKLEQGGSIMR